MAAKSYLKTVLAISLFLIVLAFSTTAHAKIIYVDDDANGVNDGFSWADAFNYLQDALAAAQSGDEIRVAQGVYKPDQGAGITPGNREATFQLITGVTLKGGYAGFGEPEPNARDIDEYETILSGDLNGDDELGFENNSENSYHVVTSSGIDATAVLDGFTITAGNANGSEDNEGGGMCNSSSSPTVNNCVFSTNSATHGGGMYNWDNSNPTLTNCTFSKNSADRAGGMLNRRFSNPTLTNCTFTDNSATTLNGGGMDNLWVCRPTLTNCTFRGNSAAQYGGGLDNYLSSPTLTNCTFTDNSAEDGGGMYNRSESNPTLTNCTFTANSAGYGGGGMYNDESSPTLIDCTFIENSAEDGGGMKNGYLCSPTLANCTFSGNLAGRGGGGMDNSFNSTVLNNCVFTGNSAEYGGGMSNFNNNLVLTNCTFAGNSLGTITISHYSTLEITSCIFWGNTGGAISAIDDVTVTVTYSDVQGGWPGEGNIDADPLFRDPDGIDDIPGTEDDNLRLLPSSPCIDAGDPNYMAEPNETDLDGKPRIISCRIDMGVFEYGQLVPAEVRIVPRTFNLASKGNWITCYIWFPEQYNVADIELNSIFLECEIEPESLHVDEQEQIATARFNREDVQPILEVGDIELKITGLLIDGTWFEATDTIKVVDKADKK